MTTPAVAQPDVTKDDSGYCLLGALRVIDQADTLREQIEGTRTNEDIEYVHKLRVASRRLRTVLSLFEDCFPKKRFKCWAKGIKQVTRFAGDARDADVQISFLTSVLDQLEDADIRSWIEYLVTLKKEGRAAMQPDVVSGLDKLVESGILDEMCEWASLLKKRCRRGKEDDRAIIRSPSSYSRASQHIESRLSDLLSLDSYLHDESAVQKHHEMRIAAKRLRYAMETLSALYAGELKGQISEVKQFQDMLGEVHDMDVWISFLKECKATMARPTLNLGLEKLSDFMSRKRESKYREFVSLWDSVADDLEMRIRSAAGVDSPHATVLEFLKTAPKVALLSDIHGNMEALAQVLDDARCLGVEVFLNAGDSVGFGPDPEAVIKTIRSLNMLSVMGNFDLKVVEGKQKAGGDKSVAVESAARMLSPSSCLYLGSLPKDLRVEIAGKQILVTHGSPSSMEEYVYPGTPQERLNEIALLANSDVLIVGHSHRQFSLEVGKTAFINPGSVGRPDDGDPRAEYAILTLDPLSIEFRRVNYDVESVAHHIRKKGLPESFAQMLLRGVSLDAVKQEEDLIAGKDLWRKSSTIRVVKRVAAKYGPSDHPRQGGKLASLIFDQLEDVHHLGKKERFWLQCGSILHDIGQSRGMGGHNKSSLMLILNDAELPLTIKERYIVGSIARYHRKGLPKKRHYNLAPLEKEERQTVTILSSIVRVADALDFSHTSVVKKLEVKVQPDRIVIDCEASGDYSLEEQAIRKKKDLFEKVFKRDLVSRWITPPTG